MTEYIVPYQDAESEFTEKRSRFITHLYKVGTEAEARARIEEMKRNTMTRGTTAGATSCKRAAWSATPTTASRRARRASLC